MLIVKSKLGWFCTTVLVVVLGHWKEVKSGVENSALCETPERFKADAHGDGRWDISDPIQLLRYLFQPGEAPDCFPDPPELLDRIAELEADVSELDTEHA